MKNLKKDKMGMTLVELVVAMVLAGMLISIVAVALTVSFRLYSRSTSLSEGGLLKSTLYSTISDELRYAYLDTCRITATGELVYTSPLHGGKEVTMGLKEITATSKEVPAESEKKYLVIDGNELLSRATYAGYAIKELSFEIGDEGVENPNMEDKNIIKVSYTIRNPSYDGPDGEKVEIEVYVLN